MAQPAGELEERMVRLETEMAEVRYLATHAERDGVELRAVLKGQKGLLSALRETQMEHGQMLAKHDKKLDRLEVRFDRLENKVDTGFAQVDIGFAAMEAKFAVLKDGLQRLTELLNTHLKGQGGE